MSEDMARPMSMKLLAERIEVLGERIERLEDHIRQIELDSTRPIEVARPEWADDILVASINALYNQRSQGAYKMAKALEKKYFDGHDQQTIGDQLSLSTDLYSAGRENE